MYWLWLIFLIPSLAFGQVEVVSFDPPVKQGVVVGGNYSSTDVAKAKEIIAATEPKELKLKDDEFELIEPTKNAKDPLQFQSLTNKVHQLIRVKPNVPFAIYGKRRGEPVAKVHEFEAKPYEWGIIHAIAKANGSEILVANRNGKNRDTDPPEEVDRVKVVVGAVKPDDPPGPIDPPVEDTLTKTLRAAAQADAMGGKADKKYLLPLAGIFEAAGNDSLQGLATMADLDSRLNAARVAAGVPEPSVAFPQLREAIRKEIYTQLGIDASAASTPLKVDTIRLAKTTFLKIAASLEVLAK